MAGVSPEEPHRAGFAARYGVDVFDDLERLLAGSRPDIVSICSPTALHREHALRCIEARVPMIWLEKPPASSLGELDDIIAAAEASGRSTILVNYQRRYAGPYRRLRNAVVEERLGKPLSIHLTYSKGLLPNGSHLLDVLDFVFASREGPVVEFRGGDAGGNPVFVLRTASGLPVLGEGSDVPYHNIDIGITCERGRASILHGGMTTSWETAVEHELYPGFFRLIAGPEDPLAPAGLEGSLSGALEDLIRAHEEGREPLSNLHTARRTQRLLAEILAPADCA